MARKRGTKGTGKARKPAAAPSAQAPGPGGMAPAASAAPVPHPAGWPADWPRRRVTLLVLACLAVFSVFMLAFVLWGGVMPASQAAVLWGLASTVALGLLHPAFALALLAVLRHTLDGLTYPGDNVYFTWAGLFLAALWGARLLFRGGPVRAVGPTLVLLGYTAVAALSAFTVAWQPAEALRALHAHCGLVALFLVTLNCVRSRASALVVVGGLAAGIGAQAAYAILHHDYVLSYVRELVATNPEVVPQFFGVDTLTPELERRLERNRAFGTLLQPNSLAALLILGVPLLAGSAAAMVHGLRASVVRRATRSQRLAVAALAVGVGVSAAIACYTMQVFIQAFVAPGATTDAWALRPGFLLTVVALPLGLAALTFGVGVRRGPAAGAQAVGALVCAALALAALWALWLSRSRGGLLGFGGAIFITAVVLHIRHRGWPRWVPPRFRLAPAAAAVLVLGLLAGLWWAPAGAQEAPASPPEVALPQPPVPTLDIEGTDLGVADMTDLGTAALRFTYWRVALRMAADNWLLGVGPGCFGVAYGAYQYAGAGDVNTAHNDYLQALAETGVLGFLLFTGFWLWVVVRATRRLLAGQGGLWLYAGLYAALLAFLLHSAVDFNFVNPALGLYLYLTAGLVLAWPWDDDTAAANVPPAAGRAALVAIPLLLVVALVFGAATRQYLYDRTLSGGRWLNLSSREPLEIRRGLAMAMLESGSQYGLADRADAQPPVFPARDVLLLVPEREPLEENGFFVYDQRRLAPGAPIPPGAFWVMRNPWGSVFIAQAYAEHFLEQLAPFAQRYPEGPELPTYLSDFHASLYDVRVHAPNAPEPELASLLAAAERWAEEAVSRSPHTPEHRLKLAQMYYRRGQRQTDATAFDWYERGLQQMRRAAALAPASHGMQFSAGGSARDLAAAYEAAGRPNEARALREEAAAYEARAEAIRVARWRAGLL